MYGDIYHFVASWLPDYARDNRNYLTVAIGCTGGRHRSVYFVERLARAFSPRHQVLKRHRELDWQSRTCCKRRLPAWRGLGYHSAIPDDRTADDHPRLHRRLRHALRPAAARVPRSPRGCRVYLLYSPAAQIVARQECDLTLPAQPREAARLLAERFGAADGQLTVFGREDWMAPVASGSNPADAMAVCPCSMGTLGAIAHGLADNLIERAADVMLKERRPLVLVPRETPLSAIHLENMLTLARAGAVILPPAPGFYDRPQAVADLVDFVVARVLDQLRVPHALGPRWGDERAHPTPPPGGPA